MLIFYIEKFKEKIEENEIIKIYLSIFKFNPYCEKSFQKIKEMIQSSGSIDLLSLVDFYNSFLSRIVNNNSLENWEFLCLFIDKYKDNEFFFQIQYNTKLFYQKIYFWFKNSYNDFDKNDKKMKFISNFLISIRFVEYDTTFIK
jgi:hypothetical protein